MQHRRPNAYVDSCCQTVYIVTGVNGRWSHLPDFVHALATDAMFTHGKSFHRTSVPVRTVHVESRYNKCLFDKRQFNSKFVTLHSVSDGLGIESMHG